MARPHPACWRRTLAGGKLGPMDSSDPAWRPWSAAAGFEDLCGLAARFLEGELEAFPGWGAPDVDEETDALVDLLAAWCRAGFLTVASQPAGHARPGEDGRTEQRRAFVCGFASEAAAQRLAGLTADGMEVLVQPASESSGAPGPPVGERGADPFLLAGHGAGPVELELFAERCSPAALEDLRRTCWVVAHDPVWNRDALWPALHALLPG